MLSVAKTRLGVFQSQSQNIKEHSVRIVSTAFLLFFLITSPVRAAINGVAAVVNGEMITAFDLHLRKNAPLRPLDFSPSFADGCSPEDLEKIPKR